MQVLDPRLPRSDSAAAMKRWMASTAWPCVEGERGAPIATVPLAPIREPHRTARLLPPTSAKEPSPPSRSRHHPDGPACPMAMLVLLEVSVLLAVTVVLSRRTLVLGRGRKVDDLRMLSMT